MTGIELAQWPRIDAGERAALERLVSVEARAAIAAELTMQPARERCWLLVEPNAAGAFTRAVLLARGAKREVQWPSGDVERLAAERPALLVHSHPPDDPAEPSTEDMGVAVRAAIATRHVGVGVIATDIAESGVVAGGLYLLREPSAPRKSWSVTVPFGRRRLALVLF